MTLCVCVCACAYMHDVHGVATYFCVCMRTSRCVHVCV